jgi:chromosome segregation ATPase
MADVRKVVGQLAGDLAIRKRSRAFSNWESCPSKRAAAGGGARLRQRIEVLEEENRRLSETNEVVKRGIGEVSECCPKVKKNLTILQQELAKLKEEMRATTQKAELAPLSAYATVPPAPGGSHRAAAHHRET